MPDLMRALPGMAAEYSRWFVNRRAYTRQSDKPHPESGRHYYYRPRRDNGADLLLTERDIERHLAGEITLGIYAINPKTQRVKWMAIDADYCSTSLARTASKRHSNKADAGAISGFCSNMQCWPKAPVDISGTWPRGFRFR